MEGRPLESLKRLRRGNYLMPMATGGGVMLGQQLFNWLDRGRLQIDNPADENYVTIQSSNPSVEFEKTTTMNRGTHGGFFRAAYMPTFKIKKGTYTTFTLFSL